MAKYLATEPTLCNLSCILITPIIEITKS